MGGQAFWDEPGQPGIIRMNLMHCSACGQQLDALDDDRTDPPPPRTGDWIICVNCATPMILVIGTHAVILRDPTPAEIEEIPDRDKQAMAVIRALYDLRRHATETGETGNPET
jgi:hypothetical protein